MNVIRLPQILADEPGLTEVVLQALSQAANKPQHPYDHKHSANNNATPTFWEPEEKAELHTDTQQNEDTQHRPATELLPTPPRSILQPLSPSAMRDELERLVLQDLLGPAGGPGEELDEGSVRDRYLVGLLAPRDQQIVPEELDELAISEESGVEDGSNDDAALQIASLCPSSPLAFFSHIVYDITMVINKSNLCYFISTSVEEESFR